MPNQDMAPDSELFEGGEAGIGAGPEKLAEWVGVFLDLAEDRLRNEFGAHKQLDTETILNILNSLRNIDDADMVSLYKKGWNEISSFVEEAIWMREHKFPLERLLVKKFSFLLADRDMAPEQGRTLSRRIIPAFQYALHQMIGPDMLNEYIDRSSDLIQQVKDQSDGNFKWSMVYEHSQSNVIITDLLIYISRYFTDVSNRREWMVDIFRRIMSTGKNDAEKAWQFGDIEFHMLIGSLYRDLYKMTETQDGTKWIKGRYGDVNFDAIKNMKRNLELDRLSVEAHSHH